MIRQLRQEIEGAQFKPWEMPVNQMNGMHLELPDMVALTPFNTVADYDNYLARLQPDPARIRSSDRQHAARHARWSDASTLSS